jgi:hypothetical protein
MERKLELKDICGYLPHRLKVTDDEGWHIYDLTNILLFQGIFKAGICQQVNDEFFDEDELFISDSTPILRPLSDLYRIVTHNGNEIVPIVKLAKMAMPYSQQYLKESYCEIIDDDNQHFRFHWNNASFSFEMESSYRLCSTPMQSQLFDYLHELKIDYRDLIDSGLAIDANTLETNPYK